MYFIQLTYTSYLVYIKDFRFDQYEMSYFLFQFKVPERDLRMTFFPQFKDCLDAGAWSFMCSYNR